MEIRIQAGGEDDAGRLTEIAHAAKRHWGYSEELLALWDADLTVTGAFIASHPVYCAAVGAEVVGFYALSAEGDVFELEHMWVEPGHMSEGVGAALFGHAVATVRSLQGSVLRIVSDPNAEGFYRRLGARRIGEVASHPPGRRLPLLVLELEPTRHS
jgi:GNAT superfamily N-acetyltransferase